ncbi:hypothetical protein J4442_03595 [Candidatus Woesearchaeota archaeon]|nr:hypothetical protein [Candidatus Woesearchaeota archaeon]
MEKILLAEFIGIMLGDGNLYCNNKGQYVIRITGDLNKDKKYHEDFISNLFYGLFNKEMRVQIYPDRRVLCCYSKHIFDQLISFGLKHGNKLENNVYIPDWIFDDDRYVMACLRGLIDTDGSVFPKSTNKEFFQIEISCAIPNLRESISQAFQKLDIKSSNWSEGSNTPNCGIYKKEEIFKYCRLIGFNNPTKGNKFKASVV